MDKPLVEEMGNTIVDVLRSFDRGLADMAALNRAHTACDCCAIPSPAHELLVTEKRSTLDEVAPRIVDQLFRELEIPNPDNV